MIKDRPKPSQIPDTPGSYQFKDGSGKIIYVGKAKSLRSRVSSYFQPTHLLTYKTAAMVAVAESVEWIQVNSDVEALILEFNLIKEHKPRYNIRLTDDKSYPYLALTVGDHWPKATVVREAKRKGVRYFGPYPHAFAIRETLDLLLRTFPLRTCTDRKLNYQQKIGKPCLLYHIERCSGPCIGAIDKESYDGIVDELSGFLKGDTAPITKRLEEEMHRAAADLEFEIAAKLRDRLQSVRKASERQEIVSDTSENFDLIGYHEDELEVAAQIFFVRNGRLVGRRGFIVDKVEDLTDPEMVARLVELTYGGPVVDWPSVIYLPHQVYDQPVLEEWLARLSGQKTKLHVPKRGNKRHLLEMATVNAQEEFRRSRLKRASDHNSRSKALTALMMDISLTTAPLRIECYDMSHLQGSNYVGSMVVMEDGLPRPTEYRRFKVSQPKNDDFGAMEEVLSRRLQRLLDDRMKGNEERVRRFGYEPNLIIVDGGRGQLNVAVKVLEELGLTDQIELAGIAKEFEEVYRPQLAQPIRLPRSSPSLFLIQTIRDEAHRFAITYHRSRRSAAVGTVAIDEVMGLGPKRRTLLIDAFGGIRNLRGADLESILALPFLPERVARDVYAALHPTEDMDGAPATAPVAQDAMLRGS